MQDYLILAINPGSTSTKVAVFKNETPICDEVIRHPQEKLREYKAVYQQEEFRTGYVLDMLKKHNISPSNLSAVVGRGGITHGLCAGTYPINEKMIEDLKKPRAAVHPSCLGGIMAYRLGKTYGIPAFVVDPSVVDEREPIALFSGLKGLKRPCVFHALNSRAMARKAAKELGIEYHENCFVVAHMGGGITVSAHKCGRVVDVSDGVDGEGPFTPERTGALPLRQVIEICFSGKYSMEGMLKLFSKQGGMISYLGTNDLKEVDRRIDEGDEEAKKVVDAMAYQVSKEIGAMSTVLEGQTKAIILTGGLAYSKRFTSLISRRVSFLSKVFVYPGEEEMLALCQGVLRVLRKEEEPKTFV